MVPAGPFGIWALPHNKSESRVTDNIIWADVRNAYGPGRTPLESGLNYPIKSEYRVTDYIIWADIRDAHGPGRTPLESGLYYLTKSEYRVIDNIIYTGADIRNVHGPGRNPLVSGLYHPTKSESRVTIISLGPILECPRIWGCVINQHFETS